MASLFKEALSDITPLMYNPGLAQMYVTNAMADAMGEGEYSIFDCNNPVILAAEASVLTAAAACEHNEACMRKTFATMATTEDEVYLHMSDRSWYDRFATPGQTHFYHLIGLNELKEKAVPKDSKGTRKLIIPRDTCFTVAGITFTIQYPIELRVMSHGGVQVMYDTSVASPIRELESNALDWSIVTVPSDGVALECIRIKIPVMQYKINRLLSDIVQGTPFVENYAFDDQFYLARVWMRGANGTWKEIKTTHSEEIIDPLNVTAQLRIANGTLRVTVPDVYIRSGLAYGQIRTDIYTTRGKISVDLGGYNTSEFGYQLIDLAGEVDTEYTSPLNNFTHSLVFSDGVVVGGDDSMPFDELRESVVMSSMGNSSKPISDAELTTALNNLGFSAAKSIDFVTKRIYHVSTEMPDSTLADVSTPIGTMNGVFETSFSELSSRTSVTDNGNRMTLLPNCLYRIVDGIAKLDDVGDVSAYLAMNPESRMSYINERELLFTPFHYVLDRNDDVFEARPYYLDNPVVDSKVFGETNATLGMDLGISAYSFTKDDTGYTLRIRVRSDDAYKALDDNKTFAQISFTPRGYSDEVAHLNGVLEGVDENLKERIFKFRIETKYDVDKNHDVIINNFYLLDTDPTNVAMQLDASLNVILGITGVTIPDYKPSAIDQLMVTSDKQAKGITHEILRLNLGSYMENLWSNARPIAGLADYERAAEDVPAVWETSVPERDAKGVAKISFVNGKAQINWLHRKGDLKIIDGQQQYAYRKGDVIRGPDGEPIIKNPRKLRYRIELFLFDARYALATSDAITTYMGLTTRTMLEYVNTNIPSISGEALEKTWIYLYPKSTMGSIDVLLADGTTATVKTEQQFKFKYYLTTVARRNTDLRKSLDKISRAVVVENLKKRTVSVSAILDDIRARVGNDVVDVEMDGMGEDFDQMLMTVVDPNAKLSLGKKVVINPDNTLGIQDAVTVVYAKHEL